MPPHIFLSHCLYYLCEVLQGSLGLSGEAGGYEILSEPVNCVFCFGIRDTEDMNMGFWVFHPNSSLFLFLVNLHNAICWNCISEDGSLPFVVSPHHLNVINPLRPGRVADTHRG